MYAPASESNRNRALLLCGVLTGPVFFFIGLLQSFTRAGFDLRRNAISQLSLGDLGWIQIVNFLLVGLLAVACAVAVRRVLRGQRGGTWGALLIGTFGLGLIIAGLFPPDPAFGFPPGAPPGQATTMSGHGALHAVGFFVSFLSVIAGCFVFARRFRIHQERGWIAYCYATAAAAPLLIVLSAMFMSWGGVIVALAGAVVFAWVDAIAAHLRSDLSTAEGRGERPPDDVR